MRNIKQNLLMVSNVQPDFAAVFDIISRHRAKAVTAVNIENILTNWEIGAFLSPRIHSGSWDTAIVGQLADYIKRKDPMLRGYGKSILYEMSKVYETFSNPHFLNLAEKYSNILSIPEEGFFHPVGGKSCPDILFLTTYTNLRIISNYTTSPEEALFYIVYSYREKLTKRELLRCIENQTYINLLGGDRKNFSKALLQNYPYAPVVIKDSAILDFLSLPEKHKDVRIRREIVAHIKDFILEMGKDFLFVDQEYVLKVGGEDFRSDLLFYHRGLQCLVAFELKARKFRPQDIGQLEFYLEALDRDVKKENENPSIGIVLCKEANKIVVEYALSRTMSPVMVSQYKKLLIPKEVLQKTFEEYLALPYKGKSK